MGVNIGFIGVGGITRPYRRSLGQLGAKVMALHDPDGERARAVAEEEGAAVHADYRALLDRGDLDAVFVCIPPFAHDRQVVDCAERGLPVFVAKPVALELDTARAASEAIERAGIVAQSGYMWRSGDAVAKALELVAGRRLGQAIGQVLVGTPGTPWWRIFAKSGGQVLEQSTHIVDLLRLFLGEPKQVQAMGMAGLREVTDFDDCTVGNFRFASGAVASLSSTHTGGLGRYSVTLIGPDLALDINPGPMTITGTIDGQPVDYQGSEGGMHRQIETFLEAIRAGDPSAVPTRYADAAKTLAATVAFNDALASGETVTVEEVTG